MLRSASRQWRRGSGTCHWRRGRSRCYAAIIAILVHQGLSATFGMVDEQPKLETIVVVMRRGPRAIGGGTHKCPEPTGMKGAAAADASGSA